MSRLKGQTVLLRADGGEAIGLGHLMRCLALCEALTSVGARPVLWSKSLPDSVRGLFQQRAIPVLEEPDAGDSAVWLVVDSYTIDAGQRSTMAALASRLMVIDDLGDNGPYQCNLLLNPNPGASERMYHEAKRALVGARYVLLRRDVLDAQRKSPRETLNRLLISCGGTDPAGVTQVALNLALQSVPPGCDVRVLSGLSGAKIEVPQRSEEHVQVLPSRFDMADHLGWADCAILAAGSVQWEAAYLGCPFVSIVVADNQLPGTSYLMQKGGARFVDWRSMQDHSSLETELRELVSSHQVRQSQADVASGFIDGKGAQRVVEAMAQMV